MEEIIKLSYQLNNYHLLDKVFGKVYRESYLKEVIHESDYIILGRGVMSRENLLSIKENRTIEIFEKNFILIQNEEELQDFENKLAFEKKENDQQKQISVEQQKAKLKKAIKENTSESISDEDKEKIFEIVLNCPIKKEEIKSYYWKVFDIVGTAEKTRNIFNAKEGIKLNKNDFPQKNRENKEEEN